MPEMRAIQIDRLGGPEVLQIKSLPIPEPAAGEVRVKIEAIGLNFADVLAVRGEYLTRTTLPMVPGAEFAGIIDALGDGVTHLKVGQRVAAVGSGGMAEYATVNAAWVVPVPETLSGREAAAFPISYFTAYFALRTLARAQAGEWVLVQAAAGALGTASVQIAKALDLKVVATASSDEKLRVARDLGADVTVVSSDPDLQARVKEATQGRGIDVLLEVVAGTEFDQSLKLLAPRGRLIFIGSASREETSMNPVALMKKNLSVIGLWMASMMQDKDAAREAGPALTQLVASGKVRPQVGPVYPLERAGEAFDDLFGRRTTGKVIIEP